MDWWHLQLGAQDMAMGLQWTTHEVPGIQSNETRVIAIIN